MVELVIIGGAPKLYTLYQSGTLTQAALLLHPSPGIEVYDFTFG